MIVSLILLVLIALVVITVIAVRQDRGKKTNIIRDEIQIKEENVDRVMQLFVPGKQISNNDVENALGVSDATAERYLDELEKQGKIRQVGKTGSGVTYELI